MAEPGSAGRLRSRLLRRTLAALSCVTCAAVAATFLRRPAPLLLWNASPSSPEGLYAIGSAARLRVGDTVIAWPPPEARRLAARRDYLPANVPLVKTAAAISGARVCASATRITINGRETVRRRSRDPSGRRLPSWSGCRRLRSGEILLLSPHVAEAFDGRYFGVTRANEIVGSGILLWPR